MSSNSELRSQEPDNAWLRLVLCLNFAICLLSPTSPAHAQFGRPITEVAIEEEGRPISEPAIAALIETQVGTPLDSGQVRETIAHLMSLNRFDDVQVLAEDAGSGIRVRYVLTPLHPVDTIEFRGTPGLPEDSLERLVT